MAYDDIWRILGSQNLAVGTAAGAVASVSLGSQTYAVQLGFVAAASSTAGCRFNIGEGTVVVSSTTSPLLPPNWIQVYKVTPGQKVAALSNDASAIASLNIVELTK